MRDGVSRTREQIRQVCNQDFSHEVSGVRSAPKGTFVARRQSSRQLTLGSNFARLQYGIRSIPFPLEWPGEKNEYLEVADDAGPPCHLDACRRTAVGTAAGWLLLWPIKRPVQWPGQPKGRRSWQPQGRFSAERCRQVQSDIRQSAKCAGLRGGRFVCSGCTTRMASSGALRLPAVTLPMRFPEQQLRVAFYVSLRDRARCGCARLIYSAERCTLPCCNASNSFAYKSAVRSKSIDLPTTKP